MLASSTLKHSDALMQSGGKVQFAANRMFGDFLHLHTHTRQLGYLISALDLDRYRVHIYHQ